MRRTVLLLLGSLVGCGGTDGHGPGPGATPATTSPQNRAPLAVGSIPALELAVSDTSRLDVSPFFRDPDGDALSYSVATSAAGTVQATITAGTAVIVAAAIGTAEVTVTATDPDGLSAQQAFSVTVAGCGARLATVTENACWADSPPGSVAVTDTSAVPALSATIFRTVPETDTAATAESDVSAA